MRTRLIAIAVSLLVLMIIEGAHAAVVDVTFEGDISVVGNPTFASIFSGTTISGKFSYQTRNSSSTSLAVYFDALTNFTATVNDVPVGPSDRLEYTATAGTMTIVNFSASGNDEFRLSMRPSDGLTGSSLPLGQGDIISINLVLEDSDMTVFDNVDTPETLTLSAFEDATVELSNSLGNAIFELTALESIVVPLPGAVWLLGSGLFGFLATVRVRARLEPVVVSARPAARAHARN